MSHLVTCLWSFFTRTLQVRPSGRVIGWQDQHRLIVTDAIGLQALQGIVGDVRCVLPGKCSGIYRFQQLVPDVIILQVTEMLLDGALQAMVSAGRRKEKNSVMMKAVVDDDVQHGFLVSLVHWPIRRAQ